ncbi:hypothetical protein F1559_004834 [Cyanidiococcus yangmingshanensis]|uniref:Uncharacterized protein n=1 Tax=Cyanidiococcus yangmingshanensis TaxID=2690220 RepID=A0A7J7IRK9_9RHOD|nr:hypothetical protein F1559_004834 [Cyanidiococcus yangmingshanensis]
MNQSDCPSKPTAPASKLNHQAEAPKHLLQASRVAENPKQDSASQRGTADDRASLELVTSTLQHALASTQTEPSTSESTKEEIAPRVAENKSTLEQRYPFRAESVTEAATATQTLGAKQSDIETAGSTASRPETIRESANPMTSKPHGNGRDETAQAPETIPRVPGPAMTSAVSKNLSPVQTPTPLEQTAPGSEPTPAAALRVADPSVHGTSGPFFGMAGGIRDFQREPVSASSTSMMTTDQTRPVFGAPSALGSGARFW